MGGALLVAALSPVPCCPSPQGTAALGCCHQLLEPLLGAWDPDTRVLPHIPPFPILQFPTALAFCCAPQSAVYLHMFVFPLSPSLPGRAKRSCWG